MRWSETVASTCRYGDEAGVLFGESEIIWEHSESDYQGFANVLARLSDGTFIHYEWSYGSCSGCDEWESRGLSSEEIVDEMRSAAAVFESEDVLRRYLRIEDPDVKYPVATSPTNGGMSGLLRLLGGGIGDDFRLMGEAFEAWHNDQEANC